VLKYYQNLSHPYLLLFSKEEELSENFYKLFQIDKNFKKEREVNSVHGFHVTSSYIFPVDKNIE
jgi:hypothetical protein